MEIRKIWLLLVDHDFQALGIRFSVRVDTSAVFDVDDLKKEVKEERREALSRVHVDSSDLTVWKTKGEMIINKSTSKKRLAEILESIDVNDVDAIEEITESEELTNFELPDGQILLMRLPGSSRISTAVGSQPSPAIPQTAVFNDNQPSLKRPRLDDGSPEGWLQLHDDDPWKLFGDYWRKKNVTTMNDVLSITLAYDEKGEEDPKYRLPFVEKTANKIIVRDCYKPLYDYICFLRGGNSRGLILNGQPGTGKTLWLSYALVRFLMANETVVYYSTAGTHLFSGNSVYRRTSGAIPPADSATFCLINLDHKTDPSEISFMTAEMYKTFPVLASSPNPSRYEVWQKQRDAPGVFTEYMPLWERDELKKGLAIQGFYNDLRSDVEKVLSSPSVDDSSTISLKHEMWRNHIFSALETIKCSRVDLTEDDKTEGNATENDAAMNDVTGDDATDNAKVTADEVLDKILDDVVDAYGSSARDVYRAIYDPSVARELIDKALTGLTYDSLRKAVTAVLKVAGATESEHAVPHTIFSMHPTKTIGNAYNPEAGRRFAVEFKSLWIRTLVLRHLDYLQHLETALIIKELGDATISATFAGFVYELFAKRELASGASQGLVLKKMVAKGGTTTFFVSDECHTIESPFNRPREISHVISADSLADIRPGKSLSDYFWVPMARNNALFDAFVIEFNGSAPNINAVVWILQMTLSMDHGGSPDGYSTIRSIKEKVQEAMGTTGQRKDVMVNYVLVNPEAGRWKLPENNRSLCQGDVYYLRVDHHDTIGGT